MLSARLAQAADVHTVEAVTRVAYEGYIPSLGQKPLPMTAEYPDRIAAGLVWLVSREAVVVGAIVLEQAPDHLLIFSLAVRPSAQGHGVGRWMLAFVEEQARAAGLAEVRLYTNALMARNIEIYGRAGYRETGRRPNPYRPGWVMVDMSKPV